MSKWNEDGRIVDGEWWQEKVYNREEWKKFLAMARNDHILHKAMEWNEWMNAIPTLALWSTALTRHSSWCCPTDRLRPPCPTSDSKPPNLFMAESKWHRRRAAASSESQYCPRGSIFCLTVPQNRKGSWGMMAIRDLEWWSNETKRGILVLKIHGKAQFL
jgi:hypothetical protein